MRHWGKRCLIGLALALSACGHTVSPGPEDRPKSDIAVSPISRCMNFGSALEAPFEGDWGVTIERDDLVRLKQAGFDTVRLPVRWSAHTALTPPYAIAPDLLDRVEEIVGWAQALELNIIVNVHHYDALNEDPDTHEPRFLAIWDQLAQRFLNAPDTLIFETLNEPHTKMDQARTDILNQRVLSRLRRDHPERWVILGTALWGNLEALGDSRPDYDPRVMVTYHDYSPFAFTHQGTSWTDQKETGIGWGSKTDRADMAARLDQVVDIQDRLGLPVFVGEFGVYQEVPMAQRAAWTRALRTGLEARDIAWCYWDYAGSLKAYDKPAGQWLPPIKAALLD